MSIFIQLLNRLCFYYVMIFKATIYQFLNNDAQSSCPIGLKRSCVSSPCKNSFFWLATSDTISSLSIKLEFESNSAHAVIILQRACFIVHCLFSNGDIMNL